MTINLYLALTLPFSPKRWTRSKHNGRAISVEHWDSPIPGTYSYISGRGWYLVSIDADSGSQQIAPQKVVYSQILLRWLLAADYQDRIKYGRFLDDSSKVHQVGFFRLDDGITWVHAFDQEGLFISRRHYQRLVIDKFSGKFRQMVRSDDPEWAESHKKRIAEGTAHSSAASMISSIHVVSGVSSTTVSRKSSVEFEDEHRVNTSRTSRGLLSVEDAKLSRPVASPSLDTSSGPPCPVKRSPTSPR